MGKPPGADKDLGTATGGGEQMQERNQEQACITGSRDKQRKMVGGGCGQRPGGKRSALAEEVGGGCDIEVPQRQTAAGGGAVGRRSESRKIHKRLRQVGQEGVE